MCGGFFSPQFPLADLHAVDGVGGQSIQNMKIVSWNINGIRTFKNGIKSALDSFDADVICVQETKVTRK